MYDAFVCDGLCKLKFKKMFDMRIQCEDDLYKIITTFPKWVYL